MPTLTSLRTTPGGSGPAAPGPSSAGPRSALPARSAAAHGAAFWAVAYAFLVVMAFSALPTPLYVLYQARDGFSTFTITLIFAAYAVGVTASLFLVGHLSDRHGRRRWAITAIVLNLISAAIFLAWSALPGLLLARFVGGLGVGAITATATTWIAELHAVSRPDAPARRAQTVATAANLGGIGLGPLIGGLLAQWVSGPLVTPYVVLLIAMVVGLVAVLLSPETREPAVPALPYHPQTIAVPREGRPAFFAAATGAFVAFAMLGLFNSLAPAFLAGTLHHTSRALAGFAIFLVFVGAAGSQMTTGSRPVAQVLRSGLALMVVGPALLVLAVWLPDPSLPIFMVGGAVSGAGAGLTFKGALGTAAALAAPAQRAEALAGIFLAGYIGLAVPVIGLGLLTQELAADVSLTIFAAVLIAGVALTAGLLRREDHRTA